MFRDRELKVTLWGQRGKAFSVENLYDEADPRAIVTLFVGCVPKEYQSKLLPSSSHDLLSLLSANICLVHRKQNKTEVVHVIANNACHWYFNPPIGEAQPFYARYAKHPLLLY